MWSKWEKSGKEAIKRLEHRSAWKESQKGLGTGTLSTTLVVSAPGPSDRESVVEDELRQMALVLHPDDPYVFPEGQPAQRKTKKAKKPRRLLSLIRSPSRDRRRHSGSREQPSQARHRTPVIPARMSWTGADVSPDRSSRASGAGSLSRRSRGSKCSRSKVSVKSSWVGLMD